ncbi:hypothetical protein [Agrobacterium vitis]|uniref:hypothetical protein n=1 Tax=Agrobacterium vitis TaxID=373 RepID=UPI001572DBA7|nr:hypothetical protein [Agrobacterium vitis]NSY14931.1 hypothetical protein [Agrobacterium vitis]NSY24688.1 hypothetical protein [Agrobacterium vitis]WEO75309.1 hypothetical protein G6L01_027225 [Agrobacterium vitis]
MRYWEACEANVTADEAIAECARHRIRAVVRPTDRALVDDESGDVIAHSDDQGEYYGGDVIGYLGY